MFLDALVQYRRGRGLPAASWAWGLWSGPGMGAHADETRLAARGFPPLSTEDGLALADAALCSPEPYLALLSLNRAAFRDPANPPPAPLLDLVPSSAPQMPTAEPELAARLAPLSQDERRRVVLDVVRTHAAAVLGHDRADAVDPDRGFLDIGFDSLAAIELRNRLAAATGNPLTPMLVFDHPNASAVAAHLLEILAGPTDDLSTATADELFGILDGELSH